MRGLFYVTINCIDFFNNRYFFHFFLLNDGTYQRVTSFSREVNSLYKTKERFLSALKQVYLREESRYYMYTVLECYSYKA